MIFLIILLFLKNAINPDNNEQVHSSISIRYHSWLFQVKCTSLQWVFLFIQINEKIIAKAIYTLCLIMGLQTTSNSKFILHWWSYLPEGTFMINFTWENKSFILPLLNNGLSVARQSKLHRKGIVNYCEPMPFPCFRYLIICLLWCLSIIHRLGLLAP